MPTYNLLVLDSNNEVKDWNVGGSLGEPPSGHTIHPSVDTGDGNPPANGDTWDGVTYARQTPADYFVIKDGATELANGAALQLPADSTTTKIITVQKKSGADDTDKVGLDEIVKVMPQGILVIDKMNIILDSTDGAENVTIGPFPTNQRGCALVVFQHDTGVLPRRTLVVEVTD